jgi:hypothetical protein
MALIDTKRFTTPLEVVGPIIATLSVTVLLAPIIPSRVAELTRGSLIVSACAVMFYPD